MGLRIQQSCGETRVFECNVREAKDELDREEGGSGDNFASQHDYEDEEVTEKLDHCKDHCSCELR